MKNQILALSLSVVSLGTFAQKAEIKAAEKAIKKQDFTGAIASLNAAEKLIANADDKYKGKFYFLKGKAYAANKDYKSAATAFENLFAFKYQLPI